MKARRCGIVALLLCLQTTASSTLLDDVPGCGCLASTTCGSFFSHYSDTTACVFTKRSHPPYVFEGVVNSTEPICDALEADPAFRETHGASTAAGGVPGFVPIEIATGTCADAYSKQNSCRTVWGAAAENATNATMGVDAPTAATAEDSTKSLAISARFSGIAGRCHSNAVAQPSSSPGSSRSLRITSTCRSEFDESISAGTHEDSLLVYMDLDGNEEEEEQLLCSFSRREELAQRRPVLTSDDWIEPRSGRRYMCHDFADGNQPYSMLVMSLGNAPCRGPAPAPTNAPTPTDAPVIFETASSSGNPIWARNRWSAAINTGIFATMVSLYILR